MEAHKYWVVLFGDPDISDHRPQLTQLSNRMVLG